MEDLEDAINIRYAPGSPGGLFAYIERFEAAVSELQSQGNSEYSDTQLKRTLFRNLRVVSGIEHLIQTCKDQFFSYADAILYIRKNSTYLDSHTRRRTMLASHNPQEDPVNCSLNLVEARNIFNSIAQESTILVAYNTFDRKPFRDRLRIPDDIWKALQDETKDEINAIRRKIHTEAKNQKEPRSTIQAKTQELPKQYSQDNSRNTMLKLCKIWKI